MFNSGQTHAEGRDFPGFHWPAGASLLFPGRVSLDHGNPDKPFFDISTAERRGNRVAGPLCVSNSSVCPLQRRLPDARREIENVGYLAVTRVDRNAIAVHLQLQSGSGVSQAESGN
jgi:hypothetical protein